LVVGNMAGTLSTRASSVSTPSSAGPRTLLRTDEPSGLQAAEHVGLMEERRVLDDQRVGRDDRLTHPDPAVIDA
jgi:hypothetical protein